MFQDETQPENHLERQTPLPLQIAAPAPEVQRKRMLIALGILLLALAAVVLRDWDFWFPPSGEAQEAAVRSRNKSLAPALTSAPIASSREHKPAKLPPATAAAEVPLSATTERAALPPLQVEVVAGNRHISVPGKNSAIHLDVAPDATASAPTGPGVGSTSSGSAGGGSTSVGSTSSAGNQVQLSPQTAQSVSVSVPPDYPLLARQMKVQGVVSLQALISRDGSIQELQILSGPAILAAAAREAVKQWHFKPYLQNGHPVETQARITVNFTISTN
jgi:protein TonB